MIEKVIDTSVAIIFNQKNEVLLQKKDLGYPWFPGQWCLPGGGWENGEDPQQTLMRELQEELGFVPNDLHLFKAMTYLEDQIVPGRRRSGKWHVYSCSFTGSISDIRIHEGGGFAFFAREELSRIPVVGYNLAAIQEYYDSLKSA